MAVNPLEVTLRTNGYSVTKARRAVYDALRAHDTVTIKGLVDVLKGVVDRASVYRAIDLFETLDIVHRIYNGWKYTLELSGDFLHHHHHMTCVHCGRIVSIDEDEKLTRFIDEVARQHNFTVTNHQFELTGVCEACSNKR